MQVIYDGLGAINRYRGLSRGLDILIDWIAQTNLAELPSGRIEICGSKVFALVQDAMTRTYKNAHYEVHHRYMDLQLDLAGAEHFMVTPGPTVSEDEFDEQSDKGYCQATSGNHDEIEGTLGQDHFAIFMIDEPHMPNLVCPGKNIGPIKKICFKVLGDKFWDE